MNIINFSAGPCQLNKKILETASKDIINYNQTGISICELSHHTEAWKDLYKETIANSIEFLQIPESHDCFFMNGGGTHQFSAICCNLCSQRSKIQVLVTGFWSQKASLEISKFCKVVVVNKESDLVDSCEYDFTYYCENETTIGFEFRNGLNFNPINHFLVCDMCSILGSKFVDIKKYGVIFSSLSKNLGISGSTLIIANKELLSNQNCGTNENIPIVMDWRPSLNLTGPTPSIMSIYMTGLNVKRMIERGGLQYYDNLSIVKSNLFYEYIDNSNGFYFNNIPKQHRSRTNITFSVKDSQNISSLFTNKAKLNGFIGTAHHPSNPDKGCRISLYNSLELDELTQFINFMESFKIDFEKNSLNYIANA
tara:strand:- start:2017 stop:3117 length:1101 start_codon:yes stop_codon:yes gene_type:complete